MGYGPRGRKESDTTERLTLSFSHFINKGWQRLSCFISHSSEMTFFNHTALDCHVHYIQITAEHAERGGLTGEPPRCSWSTHEPSAAGRHLVIGKVLKHAPTKVTCRS